MSRFRITHLSNHKVLFKRAVLAFQEIIEIHDELASLGIEPSFKAACISMNKALKQNQDLMIQNLKSVNSALEQIERILEKNADGK